MDLNKKLSNLIRINDSTEIRNTFNEIFNEYSKLVFFVANSILKNKEDAEDVTSECFVLFFNAIQKTNIKSIKYYLTTCCKNLAIKKLKENESIVQLDENIINERINKDEKNSIIEYLDLVDAFKSISNKDKLIVFYRVEYELSFKEIAKKLNLSYFATFHRYNRTIKKIKKDLENE